LGAVRPDDDWFGAELELPPEVCPLGPPVPAVGVDDEPAGTPTACT
jgi:hypothetical protein